MFDSIAEQYIIAKFGTFFISHPILIALTVSKLDSLLPMCERELQWLDIAINLKKSCCLRIDPRYVAVCANVNSSAGSVIASVSEMRYIRGYLTRSRLFTCSLDHAKHSFYRVANSIFGKIGRIASEEIVLQLVKSQ